MGDKKNTIGRFEILEKIGEGPIGAVYKALDPVIRRVVAIKVIKLYALEETTTFAEVFEKIYRVVRTSTALNHPNICIIYDLSEEKKIPFITMEYVEGQDLDSLLRKKHQFKRAQLFGIISQVCDALDFAHKRNVIHQDLKTTNILLTPDLQVKITDFGIAGLDEIAAAQTKKLLSIPFYVSPEQALGGKVSSASDLYSLGVIAYQMLSGELPFRGETAANVIMTIAKEAPASPKDLDRSGINKSDWDAFFATALAKSPDKRFRSAADLLEALTRMVPPSDHSYFPYNFSSVESDRTGEFEKTFVGEMASPTVLIDPKQLFPPLEEEPASPPAAEIEKSPEPVIASQPEAMPQTEASVDIAKEPDFSEEPFELDEEEAKTLMASPIEDFGEPSVEEQLQMLEPQGEFSKSTKLIDMQAELQQQAAAKSNGRTGSSQPTQLISNPVEPPHASEPESSRPTMLLQGTAAVMDSQPVPPVQPRPVPSPTMRPQRPKPQAPVPPRKAAGPPNLKLYLVGAAILAVFILLVGGFILLRSPRTENATLNQPSSPAGQTKQSQARSSSSTPRPEAGSPAIEIRDALNGKINVVSDPAGAKVFLNGEEKGITPLELANVTAGEYNLQLQLAGYKDVQRVVQIDADNQTPNLDLRLERTAPVSGILVVESTPPNAFIVIANRVVGVTPKSLQNWKAGRYNVTLKKDGYEDYTGTVRVNEDKTSIFRAQLVEIPPPAPVVEQKKAEPPVQPGMLVSLGPGVTPPKAIKREFAKYPETAKSRRIEGTVNLSILISETGEVLQVKVLHSPHKLLEEAAVDTVKTWIYEPASKQGVPVKVWLPINIAFQVSHR